MYCKNCGEKIEDNSRFCAFCGALQKMPNTNPSLNTQQFLENINNSTGYVFSHEN